MFKKIIFGIENLKSENDKILLETEIDALKGVKNVSFNLKEGIIFIEFEDDKISAGELIEKIKKLGFNVLEKTKKEFLAQQEHVFYVKGIHCASCEILIEKKLLELEGIKLVEASTSQGKVKIVYEGKLPKVDKLNYLFRKEGYLFSNEPFKEEREGHSLTALAAAFLVIILFFLLKNSRFAGLVNVSANSSLPTFFVLGLIAGISSCAALVGGLILSLTKQWQEVFVKSNSTLERLQPHLMFNFGRILSYGFFGGLIGALGKRL